MASPVVRALLAGVRFYRMAISPLRPPTCRYVPTCSEYAVEALEVHGAARGSWLALRRLLRCHPFHAGGHDPVPPAVVGRGHRRHHRHHPDPVLITTSSRPAA